MTTFADGLQQYGGMPVGNDFMVSKMFSTPIKGRAWFVDTSYGGNGAGKSPKTAFSTMQRAFDNVQSGDVIYFVGKVTEQLVTPVQVFDVTVVGCGNRPRHADATPDGGNHAASQWGPPATGAVAAQATVRVLQQGWKFVNILFTAVDANAACVEVVRNAGAGDLERDASHASMIGCRFAGTGIGIRSGVAGLFTEIVFNVEVANCDFNNMTTAMSGISGNGWKIHHNRFWDNTNHIVMSLQKSHIYENMLATFTTLSVALTGGSGTCFVTKNYLSGTYAAPQYSVSGSSDEWAGNFNTIAGGITVADPA